MEEELGLLQRHFSLSNITGYYLAQDKIIIYYYIPKDVQRLEQAVECQWMVTLPKRQNDIYHICMTLLKCRLVKCLLK